MKRGYGYFLISCLLLAGTASAGTWNVTNAVELKAALTIAETNLQADTIYLAAGVYNVDDLAGQLLTYEPNGVNPGAENFTLAVLATNGQATIDGNSSKQGIRLETWGSDMRDAHITVKGLRFQNCRIFSTLFTGAGLYARTQWANVTIEDCEFQSCVARDIFQDPNGGGCYARAGSTGVATVRNCRFIDNHGDVYGGGLYMVGNNDARIENCVFMRNRSNHQGGGLYVNAGISTIIRNCTFYDNTSEDLGGGMYLRLWGDSYAASIHNTIIWTNTSVFTNAADAYFEDDGDGNSTGAVIVLEYSNYLDVGAEAGDNISSNFNIFTDPLLADTNDFTCQLLESSPCIDAGTNLTQITRDVAYVPRALDGDTNGVALHDIGASEFAHPFGDTDGDGMYDRWEVDGSIDPTDATGVNGPGGNPDGDAGTNFFEFVSDTDPTDSASLLHITAIEDMSGDMRVSWIGGEAVTQYIDSATSLVSGTWTTIYTNVPPTAPAPVVIDSNAASTALFYRIRTVR